MIVVDSNEQLKKYLSISKDIPNLKGIVVYATEEISKDIDLKGVNVYLWNDFLKLGDNIKEEVIEEKIKK